MVLFSELRIGYQLNPTYVFEEINITVSVISEIQVWISDNNVQPEMLQLCGLCHFGFSISLVLIFSVANNSLLS